MQHAGSFKLWHAGFSSLLLLFSRSVVANFFATPGTVALLAPLYMGFPGENAGADCHFLLQGVVSIKPVSPALRCRFSTAEPPRKPLVP